ncbi:hypothetical protein ACN2XU_21175 [Primorskyibacter sp. 2E107]
MDLSRSFHDGYTERIVAVLTSDTDLGFTDLAVNVPRHAPLDQQL